MWILLTTTWVVSLALLLTSVFRLGTLAAVMVMVMWCLLTLLSVKLMLSLLVRVRGVKVSAAVRAVYLCVLDGAATANSYLLPVFPPALTMELGWFPAMVPLTFLVYP